jgi:hypothetical protein
MDLASMCIVGHMKPMLVDDDLAGQPTGGGARSLRRWTIALSEDLPLDVDHVNEDGMLVVARPKGLPD